jgi:tripartite-type tricarboxylate transporter receptor subunit TctC
MPVLKRLVQTLLISLVGALATAASSFADTWPQRTVRIITPLPPGTAIDTSARIFAERLSARWGQPVVVENLPGADGILAAREFVGRRDNHTLLYSFAGLITINPLLHEKLPYDPERDLVPIASTSDNFLAIAASETLKVGSLAELAKLARSRNNKLTWAATPGLPYFAFAAFQKATGLDMVQASYRDFNPALVDLGEGRIDAVAAGVTPLVPHARAGKVRLLAVVNRERTSAAPEVPTAAEAGFPELTFDGVTGFFGWRDMPSALRERIAADVSHAASEPAVKSRLTNMGSAARAGTSAEFVAAIEEQRAKIAAIANATKKTVP